MRRRRSQRGSSVLEFGLLAPLMLLISFSAVDLSRAFHLAMVVSSAARAGLHYASTSEANAANDVGIQTAALRDGSNRTGLQAAVDRFCTCSVGGEHVTCTTTCTGRAEYVQVQVSIPFETVMEIEGLTPSLTIRDRAVIRVK